MSRSFALRWIAVLSLLGGAGIGMAQTASSRVSPKADLEALQAAFAELAGTMRPSVVAIRADRRVRTTPEATRPSGGGVRNERLVPSVGSGVIIHEDGMILTNEHVVHGAEKTVVVLYDGSSHEATAVHADPRSDLAVIHIDVKGLQAARLGDLSRVRQGHWAFAMGNPFGLGADGGMVMTQGIVSAVGRKLQLDPTDSRYYGNLIQTSAAINPGNSGGPLVNIDGEIIGITTAISTRTGANEGVGFAVPMEGRTKAIIEKLLAGEPVEYGFIGVTVKTPPQFAAHAPSGTAVYGAMIERIEPGSPAERATLADGDVVLEFDGVAVEDADHLVRLVGAAPVGRPVMLAYSRQGRRLVTQIVATARILPRGAGDGPVTWRGITLAEPTPALRRRFDVPDDAPGLLIVAVQPGSPADRAGIRPGRRILKIGELSLGSIARLNEVLPGVVHTAKLTLADHETVEIPPP
jgi:serine protease Do